MIIKKQNIELSFTISFCDSIIIVLQNYNTIEKMQHMEHNFMRKTIYEISICILAIISVVFAAIDMSHGLSYWLAVIDNIIYTVFVVDYIVRLILAKNKRTFFKDNVLDLIAIIPINPTLRIFRAFKILRLVKLTKFAKLTRILTSTGRLLTHCKRFLNTNGFKYILMTAAALILIGGTLISYFEDMTFQDGIWWAFVTTTTVGYGDISPGTGAGRAVACILMIVGIGLIGSLTSTITSFFMHANKETVNSGKVDIALKIYDELNDSEKEIFKKNISS